MAKVWIFLLFTVAVVAINKVSAQNTFWKLIFKLYLLLQTSAVPVSYDDDDLERALEHFLRGSKEFASHGTGHSDCECKKPKEKECVHEKPKKCETCEKSKCTCCHDRQPRVKVLVKPERCSCFERRVRKPKFRPCLHDKFHKPCHEKKEKPCEEKKEKPCEKKVHKPEPCEKEKKPCDSCLDKTMKFFSTLPTPQVTLYHEKNGPKPEKCSCKEKCSCHEKKPCQTQDCPCHKKKLVQLSLNKPEKCEKEHKGPCHEKPEKCHKEPKCSCHEKKTEKCHCSSCQKKPEKCEKVHKCPCHEKKTEKCSCSSCQQKHEECDKCKHDATVVLHSSNTHDRYSFT